MRGRRNYAPPIWWIEDCRVEKVIRDQKTRTVLLVAGGCLYEADHKADHDGLRLLGRLPKHNWLEANIAQLRAMAAEQPPKGTTHD